MTPAVKQEEKNYIAVGRLPTACTADATLNTRTAPVVRFVTQPAPAGNLGHTPANMAATLQRDGVITCYN